MDLLKLLFARGLFEWLISWLCCRGATVDVKNKKGNSPLWLACNGRCVCMCAHLLFPFINVSSMRSVILCLEHVCDNGTGKNENMYQNTLLLRGLPKHMHTYIHSYKHTNIHTYIFAYFSKGHGWGYLGISAGSGSTSQAKRSEKLHCWVVIAGGHIDVVQYLVNSGADKDSQDNRKVSCLMAAFRKGHVKVAKWLVKKVSQFPSDQELQRFVSQLADKVCSLLEVKIPLLGMKFLS